MIYSYLNPSTNQKKNKKFKNCYGTPQISELLDKPFNICQKNLLCCIILEATQLYFAQASLLQNSNPIKDLNSSSILLLEP